jgi:uncharacterized protein (DUF2384 family)
MDIMTALGGRQVFGSGSRQIDLIVEVERGLPTKAYAAVAGALKLTPDEEDSLLQTNQRTRARWKSRNRLDPATSERVARLARILALAIRVLENRAHAAGNDDDRRRCRQGQRHAVANGAWASCVTVAVYRAAQLREQCTA